MNKVILVLIVCLFLALIGGGIWNRTQLAVAPPIYDPIGYFCRAQLVWSAIAEGNLHGILNGPMSIRPPGTTFILYPFGFRTSIRDFLFRSVFAPILIWAIALGIPVAVYSKRRLDILLGSAIIVGLTSMPMFYQFELSEEFTKLYNVTNQWGLVDSLEAAIAGLATSLLCAGIANKCLSWCSVGWFVGALSFFIKPSGLLVMIALAGIGTVELVILFFGNSSDRRPILKFAFPVYLSGLTIFGVALGLAVFSDYMSREVIAQAVRASQLLIAMQKEGPDILSMLALLVVPVFGWWWFCPGMLFLGLMAAETIRSIVRRQWSPVSMRLGAAILILLAAICWWMFLAGQAHRYLFPFLLMLIIWFVPDLIRRVQSFGPSGKGAVIGYGFAPALLLSGLLWSKQPSPIFQHLMGVNLTAGGFAAEVVQGKWLLTESEKVGRPLNLYVIGNYRVGAVEMVDWVNSVEKRNVSHLFVMKRPMNWADAPGLRARELIESDFLLLEDVSDQSMAEAPTIASWPEEVERFKRFAYAERGVAKNGLELVSDGAVKVLRVADIQQFKKALYSWANAIHWTDDFRERNKEFLEDWTR
jgi:hypothetical protein